MSSGINSQHTDAPWKPRGIGGGHRWLCGECQQPRNTTAGSKKIGARKVCKECVDRRQAKALEKAAAGGGHA